MGFNITHIFDYLVTEDIVYPEYASGVCCERQSWIPDGLHTREPAEGTMISGGNKSATTEHADISAVFDLIIIGSICFGRSAGGGGGGAILLILDRDVLPTNSSYTDADVAYVLIYLNSRSHVSRSELSNYLCIGEGSFRGLLSIMVDAGLVGIHRKGVYMMENGRKMYLKMGIRPVDIDVGFTLGTYNQGIKVFAAAGKIGDGMEQVKISTAYGGVGCTTWVMKNNWIYMPPHWEFSRSNVDASEKIMDEANMHNGDVFLMCGAESPRAARVAAMMVALDLVG